MLASWGVGSQTYGNVFPRGSIGLGNLAMGKSRSTSGRSFPLPPPKIFIYKFVKIGGEGFLWLFADCGGEQIKTKDFGCFDGDVGVLFLKR